MITEGLVSTLSALLEASNVLGVLLSDKGPNIALNERTHLRAAERHLSYGITQCYLPPDRGERALP